MHGVIEPVLSGTNVPPFPPVCCVFRNSWLTSPDISSVRAKPLRPTTPGYFRGSGDGDTYSAFPICLRFPPTSSSTPVCAHERYVYSVEPPANISETTLGLRFPSIPRSVRGGMERLSAALEALQQRPRRENQLLFECRRHCELAIVPDPAILFPIPPTINPPASCQSVTLPKMRLLRFFRPSQPCTRRFPPRR